jgi:NAD(P)-dependent dehydrogenase (short-subunit alcohol dehydrogenase family)
MSQSAFRLDGRIAIVTGASRGLGAAAATALAEAGAHVVLTARRVEALASLTESITAMGASASVKALDVTDGAMVRSVFEAMATEHGGIDILLNNAGVESQGPAKETTREQWDHVMSTNLDGTFLCAQAFASQTGTQPNRSLINIGSLASDVGVVGQAAYCASKGAVVSLTRALALEWSADGIRVNALCPGYFATDMPAEVLANPTAHDRLLRRIPARRVAQPAEIGGPVVFLASDASSYMTGAALYIDGGFTAQ